MWGEKMNDKIGCDKNGKCTATSKDECWRYSRDRWGMRGECEYMFSGICKNVHALQEVNEKHER